MRTVFFTIKSFYIFSAFLFAVCIFGYRMMYKIESNGNTVKVEKFESTGEKGKPFILPVDVSMEKSLKIKEGWSKYQFNEYVSSLISVHRTLPDHRVELCKMPYRFELNLTRTSVIITFHNEALSVLLRSIFSVLDRTPPRLLKEIILVDDFSEENIYKELEHYLESESKIKIIRNKKREGPIRSKLVGSSVAEGEVLTFLDSHIEVTTVWLEPLLERIRVNNTIVACPLLDKIDSTTFEYVPSKNISVWGFDWNLRLTPHVIPESEVKRRYDETDPILTPTLPSGIFTISKAFFEYIGKYDEGFDDENLELSFKIWMCGGSVEIIPCSRVGRLSKQTVSSGNLQRLAEVWLDDYKRFFYQKTGTKSAFYDNLSKEKLRRTSLKCNSFEWYLNNIYPEKYIPKNVRGYGLISTYDNNYCLDSQMSLNLSLSVKKCKNGNSEESQFWYYTDKEEIRNEEACVGYNPEFNKYVTLYPCGEVYASEKWSYDSDSKYFVHVSNKKCLTVKNDNIVLSTCDPKNSKQKWIVQNFNNV